MTDAKEPQMEEKKNTLDCVIEKQKNTLDCVRRFLLKAQTELHHAWQHLKEIEENAEGLKLCICCSAKAIDKHMKYYVSSLPPESYWEIVPAFVKEPIQQLMSLWAHFNTGKLVLPTASIEDIMKEKEVLLKKWRKMWRKHTELLKSIKGYRDALDLPGAAIFI